MTNNAAFTPDYARSLFIFYTGFLRKNPELASISRIRDFVSKRFTFVFGTQAVPIKILHEIKCVS